MSELQPVADNRRFCGKCGTTKPQATAPGAVPALPLHADRTSGFDYRGSIPIHGFTDLTLPAHHQVHRRLGGDVLLHSVAERWKVDAFEQGLALAEQDRRDGEVHLVE